MPKSQRLKTDFPGVVYYKTMYRGIVAREVTDWKDAKGAWECRDALFPCGNPLARKRGCEDCEKWRSSRVESGRETVLEKITFTQHTFYIRVHKGEERVGGTAWEGMTPEKANLILQLRKQAAQGLIAAGEAQTRELDIFTRGFPGSVNALWIRHRAEKRGVEDFGKEQDIFRTGIMPLVSPFLISPFYDGRREIGDDLAIDHAGYAPDPAGFINMPGFLEFTQARQEKVIALLAKLMGLYLPEGEIDLVCNRVSARWEVGYNGRYDHHNPEGLELMAAMAKEWLNR